MISNSQTKQTISDLLRISTGIILILYLFVPMGIFYFHEGGYSGSNGIRPLYGFFVTTSYFCAIIGVIMVLYNKLPLKNKISFPKFLSISAIMIFLFNLIFLFILTPKDIIYSLRDIGWIPYGEDLDVECFYGPVCFIIASFNLLLLSWFVTTKQKFVQYTLILLMIFLEFLFILFFLFRNFHNII